MQTLQHISRLVTRIGGKREVTDEELQREYLENAIKEQRIREKKRKIRRCMALFEIGILLLALFFVFFVLGR